MEKNVELGVLLDYYGDFLTDRQKKLMEYHVADDLSLAEIAEMENISRQGVRDALIRGEQQLRDMEKKLGIVAKTFSTVQKLSEIEKLINDYDCSDLLKNELKAVIKEVVDIWEDNHGI